MNVTVEELCAGVPEEFATMFHHVRALRFEDKPDYTFMRKLLRDLFARMGFAMDYVFDWTVKKMHEKSTMEQQTNDAIVASSSPPLLQQEAAALQDESLLCSSPPKPTKKPPPQLLRPKTQHTVSQASLSTFTINGAMYQIPIVNSAQKKKIKSSQQ